MRLATPPPLRFGQSTNAHTGRKRMPNGPLSFMQPQRKSFLRCPLQTCRPLPPSPGRERGEWAETPHLSAPHLPRRERGGRQDESAEEESGRVEETEMELRGWARVEGREGGERWVSVAPGSKDPGSGGGVGPRGGSGPHR